MPYLIKSLSCAAFVTANQVVAVTITGGKKEKEGAVPKEEEANSEETRPTEETNPIEETKPTEETKPSAEGKPKFWTPTQKAVAVAVGVGAGTGAYLGGMKLKEKADAADEWYKKGGEQEMDKWFEDTKNSLEAIPRAIGKWMEDAYF